MAISKYLFLVSGFILLVGCEKMERPVYSNEYGQFVRFNLQVNNDGVPVQPGEVNPAATAVSFFSQKTVQTLAIPVALTSEPLTEEVELWFSYDTIGTYSDFVVTPAGKLSFSGTKLNDTIYLDYLSRWDASAQNQIIFTLDTVDPDSIHLGNLNSLEPNTTLVVNLEELFLRYNFPVENKVEILGEIDESVLIKVEFPDGFFPGEVEGIDLLIAGFPEFDYTLEQLPYDDDDTEIIYRFTLNEALDDDKSTYRAAFTLAELENYNVAGYTTFTITKPENVPRDVSLNTAAHFYDLTDGLYRTYGEMWIDYMNRDSCVWRSFSAFTFPVVVSADHPNSVLYDDQGTLDPGDDVYHHAFRIGFDSPNEGRTTNSFNLKGWFENEYTDADKSPGFNILQALEFYPGDNGTSATEGIVKVIEQDLIITGKQPDGSLVPHTIAIAGEGEYHEISDGIFEINLILEGTNQELFGGTVSAIYKIYNTNSYEDPVDIPETCFEPIDL